MRWGEGGWEEEEEEATIIYVFPCKRNTQITTIYYLFPGKK
jgi:hypothetical protein